MKQTVMTLRSPLSPRYTLSSGGQASPMGSPLPSPVPRISPGTPDSRSGASPGYFKGGRTLTPGDVSPQENLNGIKSTEELAYDYALRVAVITHHLTHPPPPPLPHRLSTSTTSSVPPPAAAALPSPPISSTSPTTRFGFTRRKSTVFGRKASNEGQDDPIPPMPVAPVKLPKEVLLEFWPILQNEQGDRVWTNAVTTFLNLLGAKRGTKTPSGLNLREIPTLIEAFNSTLPTDLSTQETAAHHHHLINLLSNSVSSCSYFSPLVRPQSDKDRDFQSKIKAELVSFIHSPETPSIEQPESPFNKDFSALGLGKPASPKTTKRKPSPGFLSAVVDQLEFGDALQKVFGVSAEKMQRDVAALKAKGLNEKTYMNDIKLQLERLSEIQEPNGHQRARRQKLNNALSNLLAIFPDLATASGSAGGFLPSDYVAAPIISYTLPTLDNGTDFFFSPPSRFAVFARLVARICPDGVRKSSEMDLLSKCADVWGVEGKGEMQGEMETLIRSWRDSVGTPEEAAAASRLEAAIDEFGASLGNGSTLFPGLADLLTQLLQAFTEAVASIYPSNEFPPDALSPSALSLLRTPLLSKQPQVKQAIESASDELKAGAVGEYVMAVGDLMGGVGGNQHESEIVGFERVADWILSGVARVQRAWGVGLGDEFDPAAVILSKQLPLYLAELQVLEQPKKASNANDIFSLYERTARLVGLFEDACPGQELAFELDPFFEPHVQAWLRDTEDNTTHDWVSRAVGMDSWVPEGQHRHSQSVIDLFDFIREAVRVVLQDLPLEEYKRACYLIDLSKTASGAVCQYATTVQALFMAEMAPSRASTPTIELPSQLGGKASAWLAKGKQAVKNLEKKKVEGFMIPPSACVKLTDMGAAHASMEDLTYAMEAEETARILRERKLRTGVNGNAIDKPARHIFTVTITRGENLLGKGLVKAADAFVTVTDKDMGTRIFKSRTVLGEESPKWEETFEVSIGNVKSFEVACFDRQLVGKHDIIGQSAFKLDPRAFAASPSRDVFLPLNPRGTVHLRITMEGGEKHDIESHLKTAGRALDRAAGDMSRCIVDRMAEFIKTQLSHTTLQSLLKPLKEKPKKGVAKQMSLTEDDLENSLLPLFDYLNQNFSTFSVTLVDEVRIHLMLLLWRRIIDILISLLLPPLSDKPSSKDLLSPQEVDVVFKWLQYLKAFFNAEEHGVEHGVPLAVLQSGPYREILMAGQNLDLPTPQLKERCAAAVKAASRPANGNGPTRTRSSIAAGASGAHMQRSTIVTAEEDEEKTAEVLLRIVRTRPDTSEFLSHEISLLARARLDRQGGVI